MCAPGPKGLAPPERSPPSIPGSGNSFFFFEDRKFSYRSKLGGVRAESVRVLVAVTRGCIYRGGGGWQV